MYEILLLSYFVSLKCFIHMDFKLQNISKLINSSTNENDILNLFTNNLLYTTFNIGTPKQNVIINIDSKTDTFYFDKNIFNKLYKLNQSIFDANQTGFYNSSLSSTFKNISKYSTLSSICSDHFYINGNLTFKDINFTLYNNNKENNQVCGIFGLGINSNSILQTKLLEQLWNKYYISNFYFSLIYNSNFDGKLLLDELPHNYIPNKYKQSELVSLYNNGEENNLSWFILIDEVFVRNENFTKNSIDLDSLKGIIDFSSNTIKGTSKYEKYILRYFFKKYIDKKICYQIKLEFYEYTSEMIYCILKDFEDQLKLFPDLILKNNELNYEFKLTYKDLFIIIRDKVFFLVNFKIVNKGFDDVSLIEFWTLGIPFLKKFQSVFNPDSKKIGFYLKNDENNDNENNANNEKFILKIIYCIIISSILIAVGLFLGYKLFYKRKRKANELDENYDYIEEGNINAN